MADPVLALPGAEERFALAEKILGRNLLAICQGDTDIAGDPSDLNDTRNTQPALFVVETLLIDELRRQGREPALVAGHSLGELVALYAADVFDAATGLELMQRRSTLMAAEGGGAMTAVIGFDRSQLDELVAAHEAVVIANDNSAAQVVISGTPDAVKSVSEQLTCKRAIPLPVSGAFATHLDAIAFEDARFPVLSNTDPSPSCDAAVLKQRLQNQMTHGVRWRETMDAMVSAGVDTLVEIGPGNVLGGLAKRSMEGISISQLASAADLGL